MIYRPLPAPRVLSEEQRKTGCSFILSVGSGLKPLKTVRFTQDRAVVAVRVLRVARSGAGEAGTHRARAAYTCAREAAAGCRKS